MYKTWKIKDTSHLSSPQLCRSEPLEILLAHMPKQPSQSHWPGPNFINRLVNSKCFELVSRRWERHTPTRSPANRVLGKSSFRQKQPWWLLRARGPAVTVLLQHGVIRQDKHPTTCGANVTFCRKRCTCIEACASCRRQGWGFSRAWYWLKGQVGYPFGSRQILEKGEAGLEALSWEERALLISDSSSSKASQVFYLTSHPRLLHSVRALFAVLSASPLQMRAVQAVLSLLCSSCRFSCGTFPSRCRSQPASPAHQSSSYMLLSCHQGKGRCLLISCFPLPSLYHPTLNISFWFLPTANFFFFFF